MADHDTAQIQKPADADEKIRARAYEISESDDSGTPEENWRRAEREVGLDVPGAPSQP